MIKKRDFGNTGEAYVATYLVNQGYTILERNWTTGHKEIDLIVMKEGTLVFVEVKTRRSTTYGYPETAVNKRKVSTLLAAATIYLEEHELQYNHLRFDIVALLITNGTVEDFHHIQDAFH